MNDYKNFRTEEINEKTKNIDKLNAAEIVKLINDEDKTVAISVEKALPSVAAAVDILSEVLKNGGRIFYVGAGTSGRLGVLDASECPPTFGVSPNTVVGIIAGGKNAAFDSIEDAEDDFDSCVSQLKSHNFSSLDACVGLSASGSANCVKGALIYAKGLGASTISVSCNENSPLIELSDVAVVAVVGAEVLNGSTRMKAGTAQKMIINMLSTGAMILFGRTRGNYMAYMVPSNVKLQDRAIRMICGKCNVSYEKAKAELESADNSVAAAIDNIENNIK